MKEYYTITDSQGALIERFSYEDIVTLHTALNTALQSLEEEAGQISASSAVNTLISNHRATQSKITKLLHNLAELNRLELE